MRLSCFWFQGKSEENKTAAGSTSTQSHAENCVQRQSSVQTPTVQTQPSLVTLMEMIIELKELLNILTDKVDALNKQRPMCVVCRCKQNSTERHSAVDWQKSMSSEDAWSDRIVPMLNEKVRAMTKFARRTIVP